MFEGVEGFEMFEMFEEFPNPKIQIPNPKFQNSSNPKPCKPETLQPSEASSAKLNLNLFKP